jgi:hypothetical protein
MNPIHRLRRTATGWGLCAALILGGALRSAADIAPPATPPGTPDPKWSDIKSDTYEQRAHFAVGARLLLVRLDGEISRLNAKRALMTADFKDWDFDMKEVNTSHDLLLSRVTALGSATTPETWSDAKDKVGEAWHLARLALDKMNSTVTS